jgi:hypothetical protein
VPSSTASTTLTLTIGRRRFAVASLAEASARYAREREDSGLGASRFPPGTLRTREGGRLRVSYNARIWRGEELVFDPA